MDRILQRMAIHAYVKAWRNLSYWQAGVLEEQALVFPEIKERGLVRIKTMLTVSKQGAGALDIKMKNAFEWRQDPMKGKWDQVFPPWYTASIGRGDCVPKDTEIYAEKGLSRIGDLKVGDYVLSYDFKTESYCDREVTNVWDKGIQPIKKVSFRNGNSLYCTGKQPMWCRTNATYSPSKKKQDAVYAKRYLNELEWTKNRIPVSTKISYEIRDIDWLNKYLCFVIGHFVAEGWSEASHVCTSGYDCEIIETILDENDIPYSMGKNGNGVPILNFLKSDFKEYIKPIVKNSFNISIPEEMFHLPPDKLHAFLDGYFLGDGHIKKENIRCYSTSCDQLAQDLVRIHLQLGRPLYSYYQKNHQGVGDKPIWRLECNENSLFNRDYGYIGISETVIKKEESWGYAEVVDIQVDDTQTYVLKNGTLMHNCDDSNWLLETIRPGGHLLCIAQVTTSKVKAHQVYIDTDGNIWSNFRYDGKVRNPRRIDWDDVARKYNKRWTQIIFFHRDLRIKRILDE